jgi:hypothetical protein
MSQQGSANHQKRASRCKQSEPLHWSDLNVVSPAVRANVSPGPKAVEERIRHSDINEIERLRVALAEMERERDELHARLADALTALEPFAGAASIPALNSIGEDAQLWEAGLSLSYLRAGDLRRAAHVLSAAPSGLPVAVEAVPLADALAAQHLLARRARSEAIVKRANQ